MKIHSFSVKNYKGFFDSGNISFSEGFNLIFGKNNVGKSALLEALSLQFVGKPHRSVKSIPNPNIPGPQESSVKVTFTVSGQELKELLLGLNDFYIPFSPNTESHNSSKPMLQELIEKEEVDFQLGFRATINSVLSVRIERFPTHGLYECPSPSKNPNKKYFWTIRSNPNRTDFEYPPGQSLNEPAVEMGTMVGELLRKRIYHFRGERLNVGECEMQGNDILQPDASNLPDALHHLQGHNPSLFGEFNSFVTRIFPSVYEITVRTKTKHFLEIVVWTVDPDLKRDDLAIPLSESGTGIGQVLAILLVVVTSKFPRTIIIDEPNSFLHPGAARKLIEVLKTFPEHQFIISTHSPEIFQASDPSTLHLIQWQPPESILESLDPTSVDELKKCLDEVGVRLSDVFGADRILWVEGRTEELCFPKILAGKLSLIGTTILGVKDTGSFMSKKKSAEDILGIYEKLSHMNALITPAIGFEFDRENLTPAQIDDLKAKSNGLMHFLPRRTYENYLLSPPAIHIVMKSLPSFEENPIEEKDIAKWLLENGGKTEYGSPSDAAINIADESWLKTVNGAHLLSDLFQQISNGRYFYDKVTHSVQITEWLLKNDPTSLNELCEFLLTILSAEVKD